MKLPRSRIEDPQIDLTSLIDVVFLLLIFFMVTTTFVPEAGLRLSLPQASAEAAPPVEEPFEVVIDAGDVVYIGGETVPPAPEPLRARLSAVADGNFERGLRIRADGRASHQAVVAVMDAAAALGFARVDIVTRPWDRER
jgi:biopolymer transport protein ExbD